MSKPETDTSGETATEYDHLAFLERLRNGDGAAFCSLIRRFNGSLVGLATAITGSRSLAEEVVQDSWISAMAGIQGFEGRASIASWLFRIVINRARSLVVREARMISLDLAGAEGGAGPDGDGTRPRFKPDGHSEEQPRLWETIDPERIVGGRQLWMHVQDTIAHLPAGQRAVLILRDVEGQTAADACALLRISPENQRVLLHRGRERIRRAIDRLTSNPARPGREIRVASPQSLPRINQT